MYRFLNTLAIAVLVVAALGNVQGCGGDYREAAIGAVSEVLVVVDSSHVDDAVGDAVRNSIGRYIRTIPRPEPLYDIQFRTIKTNKDVDQHQKHKNLVLISHLQDSSNVGRYVSSLLSDGVKDRIRTGQQFVFPLRDRWYRDQFVLIIVANTKEELIEKIHSNSESILKSLHEVELPRHEYDVYRRGEQVLLADSIFQDHGFSIRIQHDYRVGIDTTDFLTMRRFLPDNDRWIWFHWIDDVDNIEFVNKDWINARRDSLNQQYMRGSREDAYVTTDYRRAHETRFMTINGRNSYETRGIWVMSDQSMGGPFMSYVMYDDEQRRLYFIEYGQFSPKYKQRRYVYQFEAIARTFRTTPIL
jgi:hypothetical protein